MLSFSLLPIDKSVVITLLHIRKCIFIRVLLEYRLLNIFMIMILNYFIMRVWIIFLIYQRLLKITIFISPFFLCGIIILSIFSHKISFRPKICVLIIKWRVIFIIIYLLILLKLLISIWIKLYWIFLSGLIINSLRILIIGVNILMRIWSNWF